VQAAVLTGALEEVLRDRCTIEERMRLSYTSAEARGTILNDVVVTGIAKGRLCELELLCSEGAVAVYPGDGLILSTATGATAYNLSAGGPVIVPPAPCILASPLAAHKLGLRPLLFSSDEILQVRCRTAASLFADGDHVVDLSPEAQVTIERASLPTRLVRMHDAPPFFQVLEEKLNWGDTLLREGKG
jgi:NAD+ kinase